MNQQDIDDADHEAGKELFSKIQADFVQAFHDRSVQGGNCATVAQAFLTNYAGFIAYFSGHDGVLMLLNNQLLIQKEVMKHEGVLQ